MNKSFIVTGIPRSGTSFICQQLSNLDNVYLDRNYNYEPFCPRGKILDEFQYLENLRRSNPDKIIGLKTFHGDSWFLNQHLQSHTPIVMIRKDIRKAFLSLFILIRKGADENWSTRNRPDVSSIEPTDREMMWQSKSILKSYYEAEKINHGYKVYFEDMVNGQSYPELESFFERSLNLNPGYVESDIYSYYPDPEKLLHPLRKMAIEMGADNFSYYIRKKLHI